jgi:hypothetical protein
MTDDKYKIYKLDVLTGSEEIQNDLDFLRLSEPGFTVGILPIGEKDVRRAVRFTVKNKCFYEVTAGGIAESGHAHVKDLVSHMRGVPVAAVAVLKSAPAVSGQKPPVLKGLAFVGPQTATNDKTYRISPTVSGSAALIPDKYKIKRGDETSGEK